MLVSECKKGADQYQDVHGVTFDDLLTSFDSMISQMVTWLLNPFDGIVDETFGQWCQSLSSTQNLQAQRNRVLQHISIALHKFCAVSLGQEECSLRL
jgi:hypothetical protein